jgi:hypothetical protein
MIKKVPRPLSDFGTFFFFDFHSAGMAAVDFMDIFADDPIDDDHQGSECNEKYDNSDDILHHSFSFVLFSTVNPPPVQPCTFLR